MACGGATGRLRSVPAVVVVAVLSLKGGVGKTSTALGLAGAGLGRGWRTLVVDLDPQANATTALTGVSPGPDPDGGSADVAGVLADPTAEAVAAAVTGSRWTSGADGTPGLTGPVVDLLPGSERTARFDDPDPGAGRRNRLRNALRRAEGYRLVVVDCPPSLGRLARNALAAADRALVVTEPGLFAVQGADAAIRAVRDAAAGNPRLRESGVVVNRFRERSPEHRFRVSELRSLFGERLLDPPVPERAAVSRAQEFSQPVGALPGTPAAELAARYELLLTQVLGD